MSSTPQKPVTRVFASRYEAVRRLGAGNFGTAWLVKDLKADDGEIWKVLKEIFVGEFRPDETIGAVREAKLLSKMNHPNIVKFHDSFLDRDTFCIVTEYCEGGDLDVKIKQWQSSGRVFSEHLIIAWSVQLLLGIKYIHERRVLHRDLKARNIFLKNNMIKLGDFGISRLLDSTSDMASTFTGTPYYMSPEVVKHKPYNAKSDIWSLGCVIFELCCLKHAFEGPNFLVLLQKIVTNPPPSLPSNFSPELSSFVSQMLTKDPDQRPSAVDLLRNPLISSHVKSLKKQLSSRQLSVDAEQDAAAIAEALGPHRRKKSSSSSSRSTKTAEARTPHLQAPAPSGSERAVSPRERARLRKMQEADQKAEELKKYASGQLKESRKRYQASKQSHWVPPWVEQNPEVFEDSTFSITPLDDIELSPPSLSPPVRSPPGEKEQGILQEGEKGAASSTDQPVMGGCTTGQDNNSSRAFIPEDPDEAETLYTQNDDFESDSDEEGYDALLDCMQDAIDLTAVEDTHTQLGHSPTQPAADFDSISPTRADHQIQRLKGQCIRALGESSFQKVYAFLKQARFSKPALPEDQVQLGLREIVAQPRDCFIVDQLIFFERQALES